MRKLIFLFVLFPLLSFSQVVEETIQLDTITESINVIYRPITTNPTSNYSKKIGVFANDTSKVAIEKTYLRGKLNGIYKVYYPSGELMVKTVMVEDKHNGEFTWYNENGIIRIKGIYKYGVKHGFWAYKYLKIYGRYKNGKKQGKWYAVNDNNEKIKSWYKYGKLVKGDGFETNDEIIPLSTDTSIVAETINDSSVNINNEVAVEISEEYQQVIDYLKNNAVLRKTIKAYYGTATKDLLKFKKNYKNLVFKFKLDSTIAPVDISYFIERSKAGKITSTKIDSLLKNNSDRLVNDFSSYESESKPNLSNYSHKKGEKVSVYFSKIINQLMLVEVIWNKEEKVYSSLQKQYQQAGEKDKFSILLYFNDKGKLAGATYKGD